MKVRSRKRECVMERKRSRNIRLKIKKKRNGERKGQGDSLAGGPK
jgi:hypothetical protein